MMINGFYGAVSGTLQKDFGFTVLHTSILGSIYSVTKMCFGLPLAYMCGKGSIPFHFRWMICFTTCGAFLLALPGFMSAVAGDDESQPICLANVADPSSRFLESYSEGLRKLVDLTTNNSTDPCASGDDQESSTTAFLILAIAMFCNGLGMSCIFTLGPAHINANAAPEKAPMYLGWLYSQGPLGMAVGFVVMGFFVESGAWWILFAFSGFALLTILTFVWQLPEFPAPKGASSSVVAPSAVGQEKSALNPEKKAVSAKSARASARRPSSLGDVTNLHSPLDFIGSCTVILTEPAWIFTSLAISSEAFIISAISSHGAQMLSSMFDLTIGGAAVLAGIVIVPAAAIGSILGAKVESSKHTCLNDTAFWNIKMAIISCCLFASMSLISCPETKYEGIGDAASNYEHYTPACANGCECAQVYLPICVNGNKTYFSPCHAGCSEWDAGLGFVDETVCPICFADGGGNATTIADPEMRIVLGVCAGQRCNKLGVMLLVFFAAILFTFMNNTPCNIMLMRCIPTEYSGLSLALSDVIYKITGDIPGTLLLGQLFDNACIVKNKSTCPESCAIFDKASMIFSTSISIGSTGKGMSVICCCACYYFIQKSVHGTELYHKVVCATGKVEGFRRPSSAVHDAKMAAFVKAHARPSVMQSGRIVEEDEESGEEEGK